jgi:hypothetical protein
MDRAGLTFLDNGPKGFEVVDAFASELSLIE